MSANDTFESLKQQVFEANMELVSQGLVIYTWGNVSAIHRPTNRVIIKPSGVKYDTMTVDDMVVIDLDGNVLEGDKKPSSDTPTHLSLYKQFQDIGSIVHTHSEWATSWAQAKQAVPCYGTTHCDYFYGEIPCTRELTAEEIKTDYEKNTGLLIGKTIEELGIKPIEMPGILVANHGPFTWGKDAHDAVHNAKVLDEVSKMAYRALTIQPRLEPVKDVLLNKHYLRKHGKNAYYGQ